MKIQKISVLAFCLSSLSCLAQKGEQAILSVTYEFTHVIDLKKPNKPYEEEMILRLGKTESRYSSWTDELNAKNPSAKASGGSGAVSGGASKSGGSFGFVPTVFVQSKGVQDFDLLQWTATSKLVRLVKLGSFNYLSETTLPAIEWKLFEEKKEIGGYTCQKASGTYAGRTYIAWFAPSLPFKNGPWKLSGLPGLILEARDSKGEVSFTFKELNKSDGSESTAARNTRVVKVNEKDLERASIAFENDPVAVFQSQSPIGTTSAAQIVFRDNKGNFYYGEQGKALFDAYKKDLKQRKYNPLELSKTN